MWYTSLYLIMWFMNIHIIFIIYNYNFTIFNFSNWIKFVKFFLSIKFILCLLEYHDFILWFLVFNVSYNFDNDFFFFFVSLYNHLSNRVNGFKLCKLYGWIKSTFSWDNTISIFGIFLISYSVLIEIHLKYFVVSFLSFYSLLVHLII